MTRVGDFCASNISRLLLSVAIVVILFLGVSYWLFYSPGKGNLIKNQSHVPAPAAPAPAK